MALMLPLLRADFTLIERWRPVVSSPLSRPLTTFAGHEDASPPLQPRRLGTNDHGSDNAQPPAGRTFFLNSQRAALLDMVVSALNGH